MVVAWCTVVLLLPVWLAALVKLELRHARIVSLPSPPPSPSTLEPRPLRLLSHTHWQWTTRIEHYCLAPLLTVITFTNSRHASSRFRLSSIRFRYSRWHSGSSFVVAKQNVPTFLSCRCVSLDLISFRFRWKPSFHWKVSAWHHIKNMQLQIEIGWMEVGPMNSSLVWKSWSNPMKPLLLHCPFDEIQLFLITQIREWFTIVSRFSTIFSKRFLFI